MSFNVSEVCQKIASPLYDGCTTFTKDAEKVLLPIQIITIGVPLLLLTWKIIYLVANRNCFRSPDNIPLHDPASEELLGHHPAPRKFSRLKVVDNAMMTGATTVLSVTAAGVVTAGRHYLNDDTCKQVVQVGSSFCVKTLETIIHSI